MSQTKVFCITIDQNGGEYSGKVFIRAFNVKRDEHNLRKIHVELDVNAVSFPILFDEDVCFIEYVDELDKSDKWRCNLEEGEIF